MIDPTLIGLSGPTFDVWLERGKIREFAKATYSRHQAYMGAPNPVIPPTFLSSVGYAWGYTLEQPGETALRRANLENASTLDAEVGFVFHGAPPRAGTRLTAQTRIANIFEKHGSRAGRMTFWHVLTEFRDDPGRLVAEYTTTSVDPEKIPATTADDVAAPDKRPYFQKDIGADQMAEIRPAAAEELRVGAGPGEVLFPPLTATEIIRYQGAAADYNTIHHDENYAHSCGYPASFSVGLLHIGALSTYATNWLGPENVRALKARILSIQWPGDRLRYDGKITRLYEEAGERRLDMALTCTRQTGERTLDVAMTFATPLLP